MNTMFPFPLCGPIRPMIALFASVILLIPAQSQVTSPEPALPASPEVWDDFHSQDRTGEPDYVRRSMDELEQMVAPVALYPDELLAQILPSATSPLDLVKAHQFLLKNPDMKEPPAEAVRGWDPAVVSLMQFRDVIKMLAEDIAWTTALGEAVFYQEEEVYDAIQRVRAKADAKGMLVDDDKQIHVQEGGIIRIEPSDPQVIYVPQYDPQVIYVDRPVVIYEPLVRYSIGVPVVWGLSWAFDWNNHRCVPHHHWYYTWHHRNYHHSYGNIHHEGPRRRPVSVCPPSGRPPRPADWKPRGQRPSGWKPPRPSVTIADRLGGGPGSRPHVKGTVWKPGRPIVGGHDRRSSALVTGPRSSSTPLPSSRPKSSGLRPGSRPGALRSVSPSPGPSSRPGTSRPGTSLIRPNTSSTGTSQAAPRTSKPSSQQTHVPARPGSRIGSSDRSIAPVTRKPAPTVTPSLRSTVDPVTGIRMIPLNSSLQPGANRPSRSSVTPSRSTYTPKPAPSRSSSTRTSPAPSRSTYTPKPAPSRSSSTRASPAPSRSTYTPKPAPSRSSSTRTSPAPSRSPSRSGGSSGSSTSRRSSGRGR